MMMTKKKGCTIMFKIGWIKNVYDEVYDYYYDLTEDKVYYINMAEYNKTKFQATPSIISLSGLLASICGSVFVGKIDVSTNGLLLFIMMITVMVIFFISISYDKTYKAQIQYIKENTDGEYLEIKEVKSLLKQGRIYLWGLIYVALLFFLVAWFSARIVMNTHDQIGFLVYAIAIVILTIVIKMLSPLNLVKLMIKLKN